MRELSPQPPDTWAKNFPGRVFGELLGGQQGYSGVSTGDHRLKMRPKIYWGALAGVAQLVGVLSRKLKGCRLDSQ